VSLQANRTKRHAKLSWYVLRKSKQEEKNVNEKRTAAIQSRRKGRGNTAGAGKGKNSKRSMR
ncbi:MAG TPA: hypothetical protein P5566_04110, partial [Spirochaetota bacterium]|nr:hypothetical protein [Spirochaetota bacterium]